MRKGRSMLVIGGAAMRFVMGVLQLALKEEFRKSAVFDRNSTMHAQV